MFGISHFELLILLAIIGLLCLPVIASGIIIAGIVFKRQREAQRRDHQALDGAGSGGGDAQTGERRA